MGLPRSNQPRGRIQGSRRPGFPTGSERRPDSSRRVAASGGAVGGPRTHQVSRLFPGGSVAPFADSNQDVSMSHADPSSSPPQDGRSSCARCWSWRSSISPPAIPTSCASNGSSKACTTNRPSSRSRSRRAIDAVERETDAEAIVLGYGLCSRGTEKLRCQRCQLVVPRAHDCITLLLGDKQRYSDYVAQHPGHVLVLARLDQAPPAARPRTGRGHVPGVLREVRRGQRQVPDRDANSSGTATTIGPLTSTWAGSARPSKI